MKPRFLKTACAATVVAFAQTYPANAQSENFEPAATEFNNSCASCHGIIGHGGGPQAMVEAFEFGAGLDAGKVPFILISRPQMIGA